MNIDTNDQMIRWLMNSCNLSRGNAEGIATELNQYALKACPNDTNAEWAAWIDGTEQVWLRRQRRHTMYWWRRWQKREINRQRPDFVDFLVATSERTKHQAQRDAAELFSYLLDNPWADGEELDAWSTKEEGTPGYQRPYTLAAWNQFHKQHESV